MSTITWKLVGTEDACYHVRASVTQGGGYWTAVRGGKIVEYLPIARYSRSKPVLGRGNCSIKIALL